MIDRWNTSGNNIPNIDGNMIYRSITKVIELYEAGDMMSCIE